MQNQTKLSIGLALTLALTVVVATGAPGGTQQNETGTAEAELADKGVIKRGAELGDAPFVDLAEVMKDADEFAGKTVIVEGPVGDVCRMKGCWLGLVPEDATMGIRVTFKDYGFFVPRDSKGLIARLEGTFHTSVLSEEDADHLESEGAQLTRNPDGTVTELGFVATGVELRKPGKSD